MTVWIHIGLVKTGTSTLQNFMAANADLLAGKGFYYPTQGPNGGPRYSTHYFLAHELRGLARHNARAGSWQQLIDWQRAHPEQNLILSAESFQHLHAHPRLIRQLQTRLAGLDVRIVVYLRRQAELVSSWYVQKLKSGKTDLSFAEFAEKQREVLQFSRLLQPWNVFGRENIVLRVFERGQFVNGDLIDDFLSVFGLPAASTDPAYRSIDRVNESPGPLSLALLEMFYRHQMLDEDHSVDAGALDADAGEPELSKEQQRVLARALKEYHKLAALPAASGKARQSLRLQPQIKAYDLLRTAERIWPQQEKVRFMSAAEALAFNARFDDDNARLLRRYLPGRTTPLFTEAPAQGDANYRRFDEVLASARSVELVQAFAEVLGVLGRRRLGKNLLRMQRQSSRAAGPQQGRSAQ